MTNATTTLTNSEIGASISFIYFDEGSFLLRNSMGEEAVIDAEEAAARIAALRSFGWKVA